MEFFFTRFSRQVSQIAACTFAVCLRRLRIARDICSINSHVIPIKTVIGHKLASIISKVAPVGSQRFRSLSFVSFGFSKFVSGRRNYH